MAKTNKIVNVLSISALAGVMASVIVSSAAFAAVDAYTVKVGDSVFEYNTKDLQDSFLDSKAGNPAVLYNNFTAKLALAKEFHSFHDAKTNRYIGNENVTNAFLADRANFKINSYVESDKAVAVAGLPQVIKAVTVVGGEIVLTDKQTAVVTDLKVTSVSAINLKTLVINFNQAVDASTVTTSTVKVTKAGTTVVSAITVAKDNKSAIVEYIAVAQSDSLVVSVDGVETQAGKAITPYAGAVVVTDTTVPMAIGAAAINQKQVEVYFNEPINFPRSAFQVLNNVKIDGIAVIAKATPNNVNNSVIIDFPSALKAGAHTIKVSDMVDYATFKAVDAEYGFTISEDTIAPVMTSAIANNVNSVEVTFNEKVETVGSFTVNGISVAATPVAGSNNTKFTLGLATPLDLSAIVEVKVAYVGQKDVAGNTVATEVLYKFAVKDDVVLPTVTATIDATNKVTLTFSKTMATNVGTIKVIASDKTVNKTISTPFTFKAGTNNTVIELTAAEAGLANIAPDDVTVNIKGMKDATIRTNLLPETNVVLAAIDSKQPTVDNKFFAINGSTAATDAVTFYFSEAMDASTLNNLSNYSGSTLTSLSTVSGAKVKSIAADNKSVTITIPSFRDKKVGETFTVYALKDTAGNMIVTNTSVSNLSSTYLSATAAESTDGRTIKVTFDTKLSQMDPSGLKIQKNTLDEAVFVNATLDSTGKVVTFTANKDLGTDMSIYTLVNNNASLITNIYGDTLVNAGGADNSSTTTVIADKVAPIVTAATGSAIGQIKLTFSEVVQSVEANLLNDILVRDEDGALVSLTGAKLTYNLTGGTGSVTGYNELVINLGTDASGKTYSVTMLSRNVTDKATPSVAVKELPSKAVVVK